MAVVLVVDDGPRSGQLVGSYLERDGRLPAPSGAAALELAVGADLMILDLGLPDRVGPDVARQIRKTLEMPIIILTARAGEADRIVGLRLGADDYVSEPFSRASASPGWPRCCAATPPVAPRAGRARSARASCGSTTSAARCASTDTPVTMTRSEFDPLTALAARHRPGPPADRLAAR